MLNIKNININSIGTEHGGDNDNNCTNKATSQSPDTIQETDITEKCYANTDSISKLDNKDKPTVNNNLSNKIDYFCLGLNHESDNDTEATYPIVIVPDNTILRPVTFASKSLTNAE